MRVGEAMHKRAKRFNTTSTEARVSPFTSTLRKNERKNPCSKVLIYQIKHKLTPRTHTPRTRKESRVVEATAA